MLGWIRWSEGRKIRVRKELVLGLPLLVLYLPLQVRGQERRVRKGAHLLAAHQVTRVLVPPQFIWWSVLEKAGLRPVETSVLRCLLVSPWIKATMASAGKRPDQTVVRLCGERENVDMTLVAHQLCLVVRNLIIDVPGRESIAERLRKECGMPVLPARSVQADVTVRFAPGPILEGVQYMLEGKVLPPDCERLPLLCALWECGRIKVEDIKILI